MRSVLAALLLTLRTSLRARSTLQLEILALRHQLQVMERFRHQRLMTLYCGYYEQSRTHLSLNKDAPIPRPIVAPDAGRVVAIPQVGGLHHRYERQAA